MLKNYKISIIVPIYNAEKYIAKCVESLLNQNFDSIEYIFINDCTPDRSIEILNSLIEKYPHRMQDIKIIHNEENKGSGYSRKRGMQLATGEYTIQIDSDDWVELEMCKQLYQKAVEVNADIVTCDYFHYKKDKEIYVCQEYSENSFLDFKAILSGKLHGSLCNKLIKRELYTIHAIYPPENFSLYEDKITTLPLFLKAKNVAYVNQAFLHYRQHDTSMTNKTIVNDKIIHDTILFIKELQNLFIKESLLPKFEYELNSCILYHKKCFMLNKKYYIYWDSIHPEVNRLKYIKGIELYDWRKKLIKALAMIFSKKIMEVSYKKYKQIG